MKWLAYVTGNGVSAIATHHKHTNTVHQESLHGASLFHILLCYSFIPKWIQFIFSLKILHTTPHNDNVKKVFFEILANVLQIKN